MRRNFFDVRVRAGRNDRHFQNGFRVIDVSAAADDGVLRTQRAEDFRVRGLEDDDARHGLINRDFMAGHVRQGDGFGERGHAQQHRQRQQQGERAPDYLYVRGLRLLNCHVRSRL